MSVTRLRREPVKEVPLVIPDAETEGVEMTSPPAALRGSPQHRYLIRCNVRTAAVAHLSAAWRDLNSRHSAVRQTAVLEFAPDDEANNVEVHHRGMIRVHLGVVKAVSRATLKSFVRGFPESPSSGTRRRHRNLRSRKAPRGPWSRPRSFSRGARCDSERSRPSSWWFSRSC
jgi:hypothetical protein